MKINQKDIKDFLKIYNSKPTSKDDSSETGIVFAINVFSVITGARS